MNANEPTLPWIQEEQVPTRHLVVALIPPVLMLAVAVCLVIPWGRLV